MTFQQGTVMQSALYSTHSCIAFLDILVKSGPCGSCEQGCLRDALGYLGSEDYGLFATGKEGG